MEVIYKPATAKEFFDAAYGPKAPGELHIVGRLMRTHDGKWLFSGNANIDHLSAESIEEEISSRIGVGLVFLDIAVARGPIADNPPPYWTKRDEAGAVSEYNRACKPFVTH